MNLTPCDRLPLKNTVQHLITTISWKQRRIYSAYVAEDVLFFFLPSILMIRSNQERLSEIEQIG